MINIVIVGHPNSGKSSLYNCLTGSQAKVGNWAGVTVATHESSMKVNEQLVTVTDLPGIYELCSGDGGPVDEQITQQLLLSNQCDYLINVVDATQLQRQLCLTVQLREMGLPMIVLINKVDHLNGRSLDVNYLSAQLACPVYEISSHAKECGAQLQQYVEAMLTSASSSADDHLWKMDYGYELNKLLSQTELAQLPAILSLIQGENGHQWLSQISAQRFSQIHHWLDEMGECTENIPQKSKTERIDRWLLHPWLGVPTFLVVMYLTFMFAIHMGAAFIDWFDIMAGVWFVDGISHLLAHLGTPELVIAVVANGIGAGIQTVATFIPVVAFMFLALGLLEASGYLARAAFVVEGLMNRMGLPGKAFVPLIVGFGCSVPAISSTRILESARQRIITSMMAPFMSCGARLPVYALFAAVFFPGEGANVVFGLYLIGIVAAVVTGLFLRWSLLPGQVGMTVMELPNYEWPKARFLAKRVAERTRQFVVGAGKVIVIMVTILSLLNTIGMDGSIGNDDSDNSLLSRAAQSITPIFTPMGIRDENWPATVGIITGLFAKEAVVGTLNSLYAPETGADEESWEPWLAFIEANLSISQNLLGIPYTDPLGVGLVNQENREQAVEELEVSMESLSSLQVAFGSSAAAVAYLLFVLLYTPCAAVLGTIAEELGKRWALFSALWSLALAYGVAVSYYQLASYGIAGVGALVLVLLVFAAALVVMRYLGAKPRQSVGDIPVFTEL